MKIHLDTEYDIHMSSENHEKNGYDLDFRFAIYLLVLLVCFIS